MDFSYFDKNQNHYSCSDQILSYKARNQMESSSGIYSGGQDKTIAVHKEEVDSLSKLFNNLQSVPEAIRGNKGTSKLAYQNQLYFLKFNSDIQIKIEALLKEIIASKPRQLEHQDVTNSKHDKKISLVLDGLTNPENIGMAMRLADAFAIQKIYIIGSGLTDITQKIERVSRQSHQHLDYVFLPDANKLIKGFDAQSHQVISVEITDRSIPINRFKPSNHEEIILIIGSERHGVSSEMLMLSNLQLHVPMNGNNSSMNVIHALAICLSHIVNH